MPTLHVRKPDSVPAQNRVSKAVREQQSIYEGFVQSVGNDVGELELVANEAVRSIKVRLRRAANRLGTEIQIWDHAGKVYFSRTQRRGRPRKAKP